jgi:hypothetical protein
MTGTPLGMAREEAMRDVLNDAKVGDQFTLTVTREGFPADGDYAIDQHGVRYFSNARDGGGWVYLIVTLTPAPRAVPGEGETAESVAAIARQVDLWDGDIMRALAECSDSRKASLAEQAWQDASVRLEGAVVELASATAERDALRAALAEQQGRAERAEAFVRSVAEANHGECPWCEVGDHHNCIEVTQTTARELLAANGAKP